jgi:hypothetical protein
MPTPEGSTLPRARHLVSQLDFDAAHRLLADRLAFAPRDPASAGLEDAESAVLFAGVLLQLSDPHGARDWAGYAHAAMRRQHGERDRRTLHTLGVLATAEHRAGGLNQATRHYAQLITALSAEEGPDGERALAARADAAVVEHARGLCAHARNALAQVISAHQAQHGPAHARGIKMLARLASMYRDCGEADQAHRILAQARAQAAGLPPDDPTHAFLSNAARAMADLTHQCGVESSGDAFSSSGVFPVLVVPDPQDFIPAPRAGYATAEVAEWPDDDILEPAAPAARPAAPVFTPPPAAPAPVPVLVIPSRQLPVPVPRPPVLRPVKPKRSRKGLVIAGAGAAAVIAVGLVAAAILTGGSPGPAGAESPAPVIPSVLVEPSGPVSNLRLVDQGDTVLVTWIYPANAKGPIIVSAAKAGEPMRALQSLPAGTESLTLPGLDPARNYCVTVTVAYQTEHMVMAPAVCTSRKPG